MEGPTEKLPPHNLSPEDDEDGNGSKGIVVATSDGGPIYDPLATHFPIFLATEIKFGLRLGDSVGSHGIASSCDTDMRP